MSNSAEALQRLHRILRQISDLSSRLEAGPRKIQASESSVRKLDSDVDEAKSKYQRARMTSDEKQLQLKQREDRVEDLKGKLNVANSNKEYQALKEQIAADEQANSVLSDEILEMFEKIDQLQEVVQSSEAKLKKAKADLDAARDKVAEQEAAMKADLDRVTSELKEAETVLPADFRVEYKRMVAARGENALAPLEGEYCGGCNQMLPPQTINEIHLAKPVFCKSCGCLLYLDEQQSA